MQFRVFVFFLLIFFGPAFPATAQESGAVTQRQWAVELVNALGWSFGLPDEPREEDYLRILEGLRDFRIEAEDSKADDDVVSVKTHQSFGPFSGTGWISGISRPTTLHLDYQLPLQGDYRVSSSLRRPGHRISLGGKTFSVDGGENFEEEQIGDVSLPSGPLLIEIVLPPSGGMDYVRLTAPPLHAIAPREGWQLEKTLSMDAVAVTAARVLGLEKFLPPLETFVPIEAETAMTEGAERVRLLETSHLGRPSSGRWVRAGTQAATVTLRFDVPHSGVYTLLARGAGKLGTSFLLNGRERMGAEFPVYLEERTLGTFALQKGKNELQCTLPAFGGLDVVMLKPHASTTEDYLRLLGLPQRQSPLPSDLDRLLTLLAALADQR